MDKIEKIKDWIKKQKKEELARNSIGVITGKALFVDANELLSFLDTLSEEDALPCWKKVHTYTEELRDGDMEKMLLDLSIGKGERKTKIALPDRVVDTLSEEPSKSLREEIATWIPAHISIRTDETLQANPTEIANACKEWGKCVAYHFAEWGAEHLRESTKMIDKSLEEAAEEYADGIIHIEDALMCKAAYIAGAEWQKEQMLKDAVEGEVYLYHSYNRDATAILVDIPKENLGDKVRIVVLKEEEEE